MRDFETMRCVLAVAAQARGELCYNNFREAGQDDKLQGELLRLSDDGLIKADVCFGNGFGQHSKCNVAGLTNEGIVFFRLIENDGVWAIILKTLRAADIDVSYPLLKEVCEEIVKRYVTSFIPKI